MTTIEAVQEQIQTNLEASYVKRLLTIGLSLALIGLWAQSWIIIAFVGAIAIGSYGVMVAVTKVLAGGRLRLVLGVALIVVLFASIPLLNCLGYVGTLTGNSADDVSQSPWLLGLPFLVLQTAAVWREVLLEKKPLPSLLDYSLLLLFFPKFISGPLEKTALLKDFHALRLPDGPKLERAFGYLLLGMFMKFTIANQIVGLVNIENIHPPALVISVIAFELRVYFDLAGYSFMAMGGALLVGVNLTCNFRHPFYSPNVREFWQRWHITLGRWLHATVFKPIKSSTGSRMLSGYLLPCIVFTTSAAWHGTTVNFLLWGAFHGLCFVAFTRIFSKFPVPRALGIAAMVAVILFGRLLFMDSNYGRLFTKIAMLFDPSAWAYGLQHYTSQLPLTSNKLAYFALSAAIGFLALEGWSLRKFPESAYQLFLDRRVQVVMLFLLLAFTRYMPVGLVYARQ